VARLSQQAWPGNIRELQSVLQRTLVRRRMEFIDEDSFEEHGDGNTADVCEACRGHLLANRKCREIRAVYRASQSNISRAARQLGLSRTTVYKHVR
jgi:transcriptional regulator of acetoin/glycerol metabolism